MLARTREQRSLFGEILDWMLAPLLLLWPMSVGLTWLVAQGVANQPYDRDLGDLARTVASRVPISGSPSTGRTATLVTFEFWTASPDWSCCATHDCSNGQKAT